MSNSDAPQTMITTPPEGLVAFLDRYRRYFLVGHTEPDGDCLGSQLALGSYLAQRGKEVRLLSDGPFSRPEVMDLAGRFIKDPDSAELDHESALVMLDCSSPDRIGRVKDSLVHLPAAVIDHHASGDDYGEVSWVVPSAPSVTFMILKLIGASGRRVTPDEARDLFFGLATDTGFFRHLDENGAAALKAASELVAAGASPKTTFMRMYGNRPYGSRKLLGRLLERLSPLADSRLLYTYETLADLNDLGADARDSDQLYQLLLGTRNCEAAIVIREERPGECSAGLRSLYDLDVGRIAKEFGGGGHAKAAGFSYTGSRSELESLVLPRVVKEFG
jgi:bifunctional oligoribonuclease and PAP phosphatase NrnA